MTMCSPPLCVHTLLFMSLLLLNDSFAAHTPSLLRSSSNDKTYRASVVQLAPRGSYNNTADINLKLGLQAINNHVAQIASRSVDLVVFPEAVLWGWGLVQTGDGLTPRDKIRQYGEQIPPVGTNPCSMLDRFKNKFSQISVVKTVSCIAARYRIAIVINTVDVQPCEDQIDTRCPADGRYQYNTDVVLDGTNGTGIVAAVYHKYHLYYTSPVLNAPSIPETVVFESQFGIKFGLIICFDAEFSHPTSDLLSQGVKHFIFTTSWYNSPPLFTATMFQQGFSRRYNVTVLAANTGSSGLSSGSGIFAAGETLVVHFNPKEENLDTLLTSDVPFAVPRTGQKNAPVNSVLIGASHTISKACTYNTPSLFSQGYCTDLPNSFQTSGNATISSIVDSNFTCSLFAELWKKPPHLDAQEIESSRYTLFASSGAANFGPSGEMFVQTCGLIYCDSDDNNKTVRTCRGIYGGDLAFKEVALTASFASDAAIFPMAAVGENASLLPSKDFTGTGGSIVVRPDSDASPLFSVLLYGLADRTHSIRET